jgi:hypothetical protein
MQDTKALTLLKSLNKDEFLRLGKFLRSPFYNYSKPPMALYEHLKKYYPDFDSKKLEKEKVWAKLYPDKPFNENNYWKLCFSFYKLLEKYLSTLQLEAEANEDKKLFIRALGQRNVFELFEKETISHLKKLEELPFRNAEYYDERTRLNFDYFFHPLTTKLDLGDDTFNDLSTSFDRYFLLTKMRMHSERKAQERVFTNKKYNRTIDLDLKDWKGKLLEGNANAEIYSRTFDLFKEGENEELYFSLKEMFQTHISVLGKWDSKMVSNQLANYAIKKVNTNNTEFLRELFDLNRLCLEHDLVLNNGKINDTVFSNIVKIGCLTGAFKWTEDFINDYEKHLNENWREDGRVMSLAVLSYSKHDYYGAIELLDSTNFVQVLYQLEARILSAKAWFENYLADKKIYDLALAKLNASDKFFRRETTVTELKKMAHLHFILEVKHLIELIHKGKKGDEIRNEMQRRLAKRKNMVSKNWLIMKASDL